MTSILLTTEINATIQRCFDLSRDVDIHLQSTEQTNEKVVAGRTIGLFEQGDTVTWEAIHFGIKQQLSTKITQMNAPTFFEDIMTKGAFKSMRHEHHFEEQNGRTYMKDIFRYETPYGLIGQLFDKLVLRRYMTGLLVKRNAVIKTVAEQV
jgi:ligand-binding SRPBCC domain-containing protein